MSETKRMTKAVRRRTSLRMMWTDVREGNLIGECIMDPITPRTASVIAKTDMTVVCLTRDDYTKLM